MAPRYVFQVNVAEALASVARQGMGICLLPSYIAVNYLRDGSLVRLLPNFRLRNATSMRSIPRGAFSTPRSNLDRLPSRKNCPERLQLENRVLETSATGPRTRPGLLQSLQQSFN